MTTERPAPIDTAAEQAVTAAVLRPVYFVGGLAGVALGIIGAFVPLMPSTIFFIIAAWCFARSSPRLEARLLNDKRIGPILVAWRRERAIPRRAKILACMGMALGLVLFAIGVQPGPWLMVGVTAAILACAAYVVSRPEPGASRLTPSS